MRIVVSFALDSREDGWKAKDIHRTTLKSYVLESFRGVWREKNFIRAEAGVEIFVFRVRMRRQSQFQTIAPIVHLHPGHRNSIEMSCKYLHIQELTIIYNALSESFFQCKLQNRTPFS
ncbi:hypothetical protein AVEN_259780-1, partial [Araneus ventricosus]